jgi:hypothetical protein
VDVEALRLIAGETAGDALKRLADRVQMVQSFAQAEVGEGPSSPSFCLLVGLRLKISDFLHSRSPNQQMLMLISARCTWRR